MKLDQNSISARLFRWFYATNGMPKNLCPYFWKLVLMWVFILPYTILSLPVILRDWKDPYYRTTLERMGTGVLVWFFLGIAICMLSWVGLFFTLPTKDGTFMHILVIGGIGWMFSIVIGGIEIFKWAKEKWGKRNIKYDESGYRRCEGWLIFL